MIYSGKEVRFLRALEQSTFLYLFYLDVVFHAQGHILRWLPRGGGETVGSVPNSKCLFGFTQKASVSSLVRLCSLKYLVWDPCADTDGGCIPASLSLSLSVPQRATCVCIVTMQMIDYRRAVDTQCRMILMKTSTSQRPCAAPNIAAAAAPRSNRNLRLRLLPPHPLWFWLSTNPLCARAAFTLPLTNSSVDRES